MAFEIYIPEDLKFSDYVAVLQTARTWADGYDRKVNNPTSPSHTFSANKGVRTSKD